MSDATMVFEVVLEDGDGQYFHDSIWLDENAAKARVKELEVYVRDRPWNEWHVGQQPTIKRYTVGSLDEGSYE